MESSQPTLRQVYDSFVGAAGSQMDGKTFAKLAKDCKIVDKKLTATDIDLIFAKAKKKTERKINFEEFQKALQLCAEKKGCDEAAIHTKLQQHGGPSFSGTVADNVKFHDDKNLYTGVYAQGGPTNVDSIHPTTSFGQSTGGGAHEEEKKGSHGAVKANAQMSVGTQPAESVEEVFRGFSGGAPDMDGKTFAKFAKDCKILDKKLTATDIDLIFAKVKDKTARRITLPQFLNGLNECAAKKGITVEALKDKICQHGGPVFTGTKTDNVKFHDDKSLYTGVYAQGGPTTVDAGRGAISDISQLCDRSGADVRGVKK